ncbi:hypothetical protein JCGZ_18997 [Jatropha curcas]|uniref:non-specific serine/threonine protein kinase n=1 Tax=Jatropha curcas TaxID=180498 RepID=A0A067JVK2_JATCU|nr:LEAF RUST 10 DISEASE-RESISTANCE LOCUS RECEPTOR-LIKE PROTEIN KINASE-like 1.2 [Jatropha curcas]KDP27917.1 hypothetical protein JCGZ_18997 [Jatropha curcas]
MGYYLAHHLPSLLILLGFLLYNFINGDSINIACSSFDCGNGITFGYPFWHQSQQFEHCGYSGFNLSCNDQNPMLFLPNQNLYPIKDINYSKKSLTLAYPVSLTEAKCPKITLTHDIISINTAFFHTSGNENLHFFYNCSLYPPSVPHIGCLEYGAMRSYVFKEGLIPEFDWHRYCESGVTVPVTDKAEDGDLVMEFGQALRSGFRLEWKQPDQACQTCEASGGFCSYSNGVPNFFCICSSGKQKIDCNDNGSSSSQKGSVSTRQEPNYIAIGALLFGGLVVAATVFYLLQKKKVGSYKPV